MSFVIRRIQAAFVILGAALAFAGEAYANAQARQFIEGGKDDTVSMSSLARTEQKLGYMGDVDNLRRHFYKCITLDIGGGVILGGFGCEVPEGRQSGTTPTNPDYQRMQEIFSGTTCEQNAAWEAYTATVSGHSLSKGSVSCSALASSYCSAKDKTKAAQNMGAYYDCYKNGVITDCQALAEQYCEHLASKELPPSDEEADELEAIQNDASTTPEEKAAAAAEVNEKTRESEKSDAEAKAQEALSNAENQKCVVNGAEVNCKDLAEANEIRKVTEKDAPFEEESTSCDAPISCKDELGHPVSCADTRDLIQCGMGLYGNQGMNHSCIVGGVDVGCAILGAGTCTQEACTETCPEYGGRPSNNVCICNAPPVCSGMNQTGVNRCPLGGVPKGQGTMECVCNE